jgi:hypothetical protein
MTLTRIFNKHLLKACGTNNILQKVFILYPEEADDEIHTLDNLVQDQRIIKLQA